jgi:hypothetical protein
MKYYKEPLTNELYAYEADGSQDEYIKAGLVAITVEEADAIRAAALTAAQAALTYAEKRAAAYPSIVDQLDLLYHGGMDAWKAAIETVKLEYPKP